MIDFRQITLFMVFFGIFAFNTYAQDSTKLDPSANTKTDSTRLFSDKPVKSPAGAVLRSAILPGWGQFYNESYIKAGVALALNGALVGAILYYNDQWQSEQNVNFRNKRDTYIWIWGVTYLLTLFDAYVDANLHGFDDVMNISYLPPQKTKHPGMVSLQFRF